MSLAKTTTSPSNVWLRTFKHQQAWNLWMSSTQLYHSCRTEWVKEKELWIESKQSKRNELEESLRTKLKMSGYIKRCSIPTFWSKCQFLQTKESSLPFWTTNQLANWINFKVSIKDSKKKLKTREGPCRVKLKELSYRLRSKIPKNWISLGFLCRVENKRNSLCERHSSEHN